MFSIRNIERNDVHMIYEWSNDMATRLNSYNSNAIEWSEHLEWFNNQLNYTNRNFIILADSEPIGMVRFSGKTESTLIGVVIAPQYRGRGYAAQAILLCCNEFIKLNPNAQIYAYIKIDNIGSIKSFEKAYFRLQKYLEVQGQPSIEMKFHNYE